MSQNTFTYKRETMGSGTIKNEKTGETSKANSGMPGSGLFDSSGIKNFGQTPKGTYTAENCRSGKSSTGGIPRCDLKPTKDTDVKGRTHLQIHGKSTNAVKSATNTDSRGCIATKAAKDVKNGDKIVVE